MFNNLFGLKSQSAFTTADSSQYPSDHSPPGVFPAGDPHNSQFTSPSDNPYAHSTQERKRSRSPEDDNTSRLPSATLMEDDYLNFDMQAPSVSRQSMGSETPTRRSTAEPPNQHQSLDHPRDKFRAVPGPSRTQLDTEKDKRHAANVKVKEMSRQNAQLNYTVGTLKEQMSVQAEQLANLHGQLSIRNKELDHFSMENESLRSKVEELANNNLEGHAELERLKREHTAVYKAMEDRVQQNAEIHETLKSLQGELEKLKTKQLQTEKLLAQREEEIIHLRTQRVQSTSPSPAPSGYSQLLANLPAPRQRVSLKRSRTQPLAASGPRFHHHSGQAPGPSSSSKVPGAPSVPNATSARGNSMESDNSESPMDFKADYDEDEDNQGFEDFISHPQMKSVMQSLVVAILKRLGVEPGRGCLRALPKRQPHPGSAAHRRQIIKDCMQGMSFPEEQTWRRVLRVSFKLYTETQGINKFRHYHPASYEQVSAFEDRLEGATGPSECGYPLFFGEKWRNCKWNRAIVNSWVQAIQEAHPADEYGIPELSSEQLSAIIWDLIIQAQCSWKATQPRFNRSANRAETREEAEERASQQDKKRAEDTAKNSRKKRKSEERVKYLENAIAECYNAHEANKLREKLTIVRTLGREGASSDEDECSYSDTGNFARQLKATIPYWRRRKISELMGEVEGGINAELPKNSNRRGRQRTTFTSKRSRCPKGLPASYYHRKYLNSLTPGKLDDLEMVETQCALLDDRTIPGSDSE